MQEFVQGKSQWPKASILLFACFCIEISANVRLLFFYYLHPWLSRTFMLSFKPTLEISVCTLYMQLFCLLLYVRFVQTLNVCGLFPQFKLDSSDNYVVDTAGVAWMAAAQMAINNVNDKSDDMYDDLLPTTQVRCRFRHGYDAKSARFFSLPFLLLLRFREAPTAHQRQQARATAGPGTGLQSCFIRPRLRRLHRPIHV